MSAPGGVPLPDGAQMPIPRLWRTKALRVLFETFNSEGAFADDMSVISKDDYYLRIAQAVSARANCVGRKVGAVIVKGDRIVATGYNGTAADMPNCLDGGCWRCNEGREQGGGYDICSCVHAEGNALASAARFGVPLDGATVYSTLQPCFSCAKELVQAGIVKVLFINPLEVKPQVAQDYARLQQRLEAEQRVLDATELCPACSEATAKAA